MEAFGFLAGQKEPSWDRRLRFTFTSIECEKDWCATSLTGHTKILASIDLGPLWNVHLNPPRVRIAPMAIRVWYTFRFYLGLDSDFAAELPRKANIFRNSRIRILLWSLALRCRSKRERFPFLQDMQSPFALVV
jgi:hypothetical protein